MLKPKLVVLFFGTLALSSILLGFIIKYSKNNKSPKEINQPSPYTTEVKINNSQIFVDIADTADKQRQGLSGRYDMKENEGILFSFAYYTSPSFWMKEMLFPLDFIWIKDGEIVQIDENIPAPAPGTPDNELNFISPRESVNYVLEVNAGFVEKNGIEVGDEVVISAI